MSRWASIVAVALATVVVGPAQAAKDAPEVAAAKAVVAAQAEALRKGNAEAFAATFAADAFAFFPQFEDPGGSRAEIELHARGAWIERVEAPDKVKVVGLKVGVLPDAAWVTFELQLTTRLEAIDGPSRTLKWTVRATELVRKDASGAWLVQAAHFSEAMSDQHAIVRAQNGDASALPAVRGGGEVTGVDGVAAWLDSPDELAARVGDAAATTLIGSAAKERALGPAAVKKLAGSWKRARFQIVGGVREWRDPGSAYLYVAANVSVKLMVKQQELTIPYRALLIAHQHADGAWRLASAHYSNP